MVSLETIVSLAKRRGFVFPGSEIYGGLAGTWSLGPLGAELAYNIKELWWNHFVRAHDEMYGKKCPECGGALSEPKQFNLMFKSGDVYLRPEIAQGMFVNFKNILDTMRPNLPFGIAQIGRAFRNEIAPRDFLFRIREFDLMEF